MSEEQAKDYLGRSMDAWKKQLRKSKDPIERRLAAYALEQIGSKKSVKTLEEALEDEEDFVRVWAAAALGTVEEGNAKAIAALVRGMKEKRPFVRSLAVWHLSRLKLDTKRLAKAVDEVKALFDDPDPSVRVEAQLAWKRMHAHTHLTH